jgi:hypothetical protein
MAQTHGVETPLYDPDVANQKQNAQAENFMSDYDILSPAKLIALSEEGTPEAIEQLMAIEEKFDIPFDAAMSPRARVDRIILAMDSEDAPNMFLGTE